MTNEALQAAMAIWKAYNDKPCRPPFLVPSALEIQSAYTLADAFLQEHHPDLRDRMACNRCDLKAECEFSLEPYNLDCVAKVDCLATK